MKYIHYIATLVALFAVTSCFVDDLEQPTVATESKGDITVVGRVARFRDCQIDTKGTKDEGEANVTCMAIAMFPIVDGQIGSCVHYEYKEGSQLLFTIDRQIRDADGNYIYTKDAPYVMYVFANIPEMTKEAMQYKTLAEMKATAYSVESIDVPTNGFPMIGSLGDNGYTSEGDGNKFILKPGSESNPTLPLVNGTESDLLNIPMKAMFAKVNFTIKVTSDQTLEGKFSPQFTLNSYAVNNVPKKVDFTTGGDSDSDVTATYAGLPITSASNVARGANTVNFTFYLPERYLTPTKQAHDGSQDGGEDGYYDYPFPVVNGKYRDEDLNLRQRFKPLLPEGQSATYVTLNGTFLDHQNHEFDVVYDIYLGTDNYGNFDVERNCEYHHYITIRGLTASEDQVNYDQNSEMPVSIDHRVDVTRVNPLIINLRRETLLDSHFEVRPLRFRKNPGYSGDLTDAKVKVEVIYATEPTKNWIGLERSFGNGVAPTTETNDTYLMASELEETGRKNAAGKRKYFTYDLTYSTLAGTGGDGTTDADGYSTVGGRVVTAPVTNDDSCVWIYIDEADPASAKDGVRSATIRVSCAPDGVNYGDPVDYVINQRELFPVTYNGNTYYIEYHEEYLHNYDAEDSYGQTEYEGMEWGLDGVQLSHQHRAYFADGGFAGIINWILDNDANKTYYDFYLTRDINHSSATRRDNSGYEFCKEIIQTINGHGGIDNDETNNIDVLDLGHNPQSAVEYCYNKNKRNDEGHVVWQNDDGTYDQTQLNWYLPAIDEIENIVSGAYSEFLVFQDKYYWSSQPSFYRGKGHYYSFLFTDQEADYYFDDISSARATKIIYIGNNEYDNVSSGVDGYEQLMEIYKPLWGTQNQPELIPITKEPFNYSVRHDGRTFSITINQMTNKTNHPGNDLRTQKNRVRCVRLMPAATTNE